jgi:hypothetical protein
MSKVRWGVRCSATSKRTGLPCGGYAMTGGYVCRIHGGASPVVRAAARRRWLFEQMLARIERDMERAGGKPVSPLTLEWMRAQFAPDPATFRRHRALDDPTEWHPRVIVPALALMAAERRRAAG